jgi:hypothetical protein
MVVDFDQEIAALVTLGVRQLLVRYHELFGERTRTGNKAWLIKRIAWRLQASAGGGLSERARCRAEELARDADLRLSPPRDAASGQFRSYLSASARARRLPRPGTMIRRRYRGQVLEVLVLADGFQFEGEVYASLSAVAKRVTGSHCNGLAFYKVALKGSRA